ncbi:MAG: TlpA family protein disulfide reductase [Proteiniphilum sp.]|jgi:peroxiredoxin|nr:TlpA family protein disulfide reductase [Proteiniphilum sp.]
MKYVNFCLLAIFSLALSAVSVKNEFPSTGYHPGETIPDIVLTNTEGTLQHLHDFKGKKVVVNFWAAYDAQSRATNVQLHNYLKMNHPEIEFLSISFDENRNVVEKTLVMDNLENISQFYEMNGTRSDLYKDFKLRKGFRNYLIDENGVITAMNITPGDLRTIL